MYASHIKEKILPEILVKMRCDWESNASQPHERPHVFVPVSWEHSWFSGHLSVNRKSNDLTELVLKLDTHNTLVQTFLTLLELSAVWEVR